MVEGTRERENMPEVPGGNDRHRCRTLNEERKADAGDDMPEIRDGLGSPFCLRRSKTTQVARAERRCIKEARMRAARARRLPS